MKKKTTNDIVYIEDDPKRIKSIVAEILALNESPSKKNKDDLISKKKELVGRLKQMTVFLPGGEQTTFEKTVDHMLKDFKPSSNYVPNDDLYSSSPFKEIGNIPIVSSIDQITNGSYTRVRDIFKKVVKTSTEIVPVFTDEEHSHTLLLHTHAEWSYYIFYTSISAWTKTDAEGWDAADVFGGAYAQAKDVCSNMVIPPEGDPLRSLIIFLKTAACNYAMSAPMMPWVSIVIRTLVKEGITPLFYSGGDPSYAAPDQYVLLADTVATTGHYTAGLVRAHHWTTWAIEASMCCRHEVKFKYGVQDRIVEHRHNFF